MKSVVIGLFALVLLSVSSLAQAHPPRHPPNHPGWGYCTVQFKKCDFMVGGFCVKWNRKAFNIPRRDYYYGCQIAQREYGVIKDCFVTCR